MLELPSEAPYSPVHTSRAITRASYSCASVPDVHAEGLRFRAFHFRSVRVIHIDIHYIYTWESLCCCGSSRFDQVRCA